MLLKLSTSTGSTNSEPGATLVTVGRNKPGWAESMVALMVKHIKAVVLIKFLIMGISF
jgi:hypothetical protein